MARKAGPFRGLIVSILIATVFWLGIAGLLFGRGCSDRTEADYHAAGQSRAYAAWKH